MVEYMDVYFEQNIDGLNNEQLVQLLLAQCPIAQGLSISVQGIMHNGIAIFRVDGNAEQINAM